MNICDTPDWQSELLETRRVAAAQQTSFLEDAVGPDTRMKRDSMKPMLSLMVADKTCADAIKTVVDWRSKYDVQEHAPPYPREAISLLETFQEWFRRKNGVKHPSATYENVVIDLAIKIGGGQMAADDWDAIDAAFDAREERHRLEMEKLNHLSPGPDRRTV